MDKIFINGQERDFGGLVHTSTDYNKFSHLLGNRHVRMDAVKGLEKSMMKTGIIPMPIVVNEKYEIIDGQHRAAAIAALGGTVYYIIVPGLTLNDCISINSQQHGWRSMDYIYTFAELHYPQYEALVGYIERNPDIDPEVVARAMFDCHGGPLFKRGDGKLIDINLGLAYLNAIRTWNSIGKYKAKSAFVDAMKTMAVQGADINELINAIKKYGVKYKDTCLGSAEPAYMVLTDLYNYKKSNRRIDFKLYGATSGRMNYKG